MLFLYLPDVTAIQEQGQLNLSSTFHVQGTVLVLTVLSHFIFMEEISKFSSF